MEYKTTEATGYGLQGRTVENTIGRETSKEKESETSRAMGYLQMNLDTLLVQIKLLETKLSPVLRIDDIVESDKPVNPEFRTPLAQSINDSARNTSHLSDRIQSLLFRIEL